MALHRGIQSALFYYLACTPCAEGRVRKRRKQETERNRLERAALEGHMPGRYVHPEPSATNPFWQAEIEAGPIPSRTRKRTADINKAAKASSTRSNLASSVSVDASLSMERSDSALSGLAPYQRNDETPWGPGTSDIAGRTRPGTNSTASRDGLPARPARAMCRDVNMSRSYNHPQNPALNDLHPPTTRKVQSKEDVMWMLQPPPVPEVMNGKAATQLGRANSVSHRSTTLESDMSSRATSERQFDGNVPNTTSLKSRANDHDHDHDNSQYLTVPIRPHELRLTRSRTLPLRHLEPDVPQTAAHASVRRTLPTGHASKNGPADHIKMSRSHGDTDGSENNAPLRTADRIEDDGKTHTSSTATIASKEHGIRSSSLVETRMFVPAQDSGDEHGQDSSTTPEAFDSWARPDFEFPQWIHDHTKREVRERWSFDI